MDAQTPALLTLETFLPYRLNVLASTVSHALSRLYADRYGIGIPEWRVVATLGQYGTMTAKDIGTHSHMHKTKVSRAVAALKQKGLINRKINREDMREVFLTLTPRGLAIYRDLAPSAISFSDKLTSSLTAEEQDVLERILARLTARSEELAEEISRQVR